MSENTLDTHMILFELNKDYFTSAQLNELSKKGFKFLVSQNIVDR